jgi:predicted phosphodiesterase
VDRRPKRQGHGARAAAAAAQPGAPEDGIVRVVVTADNHLSAYTPKLSPQRLSERRQRLRHAFRCVVDEAIARGAHLFIQAGDLFDSTEPRNLEREFVAAQLARLRDAGVRVFAVSGNHDTPRQRTEHGGASPQGVYAELGGLHYFTESHRILPVSVAAGGLNLAVAGLSVNPGAAPGGDPLDSVQLDDPQGALAQADLGILTLHAMIEGHGFPGEDESIVRRASLEQLSGFKLVVAGHVHAYRRFVIGDKTVVVCGPTERMEFGEAEGAPGFAYLELSPAGVHHAEHVAIPPQPRHVVTVRTPELWPPQHGAVHQNRHADAEMRADALARESAVPAGIPADVEPVAEASTTAGAPIADALPTDALPTNGEDRSHGPTQALITRVEPVCTSEAMVRLRLEGPITPEQYRTLELRQVWLFGQRHAFSFEVDETGLTMQIPGSHDLIARGERVAPHEMLEQVAREWLERAETPEARMLLAKTRDRVLMAYDQLTGREADQ